MLLRSQSIPPDPEISIVTSPGPAINNLCSPVPTIPDPASPRRLFRLFRTRRHSRSLQLPSSPHPTIPRSEVTSVPRHRASRGLFGIRGRSRTLNRASITIGASPTRSRGSILSFLHDFERSLSITSLLSISSGRPSSSSSSSHRIYGPRELKDEFHMYKEGESDAVLAKIEKMYRQANQDKHRLDSGYCCCLGLLDPVTNIRINGIMYDEAKAAPPAPGKGGDIDMAQRSLDGLVTFLTCLFPYLPVGEALAYLNAAGVDPLVAARLIVRRRGLRGFDVRAAATVDAVETALGYAAVAAQHPDPQLFVSGWKSVSSAGLANFASHLLSDGNAIRLIQTPKDNNLELQELWALATGRLQRLSPIGKELPPTRGAMKRMLLATIHEFYLKALGSLPRDELTHRYHRSLLVGGYCLGPLHPVENIIVNTIWYEQTFPSSAEFTTFMISTSCLWRVAARSMYGLISFLCTRYPGLTPDLALQRLLMAGANLGKADPCLVKAPRVGELEWSEAPQIGSGMNTAFMQKSAVRRKRVAVPEAYVAAATAVFHPNPSAVKDFLASPDSVEKLEHISYVLLQCVHDGNQIPKYQFHMLCTEVSKCASSVGMSHQPQEPKPIEINKDIYHRVSGCIAKFWDQHSRVFIKVKVALEEFNKITASNYQLHVICGVNEFVCGPHFCASWDDRRYNPWTPHKYLFSHANFLATTTDDAGNRTATLFFAEFDNHGTGTQCVPTAWPF